MIDAVLGLANRHVAARRVDTHFFHLLTVIIMNIGLAIARAAEAWRCSARVRSRDHARCGAALPLGDGTRQGARDTSTKHAATFF